MTPGEKRQFEIERERRGRLPLPIDGYDWKTVARERNLPEPEIEQLHRQKLLIGRREFRQSFEVYTHPVVPVFITSDSLLNAFHSLFEDTFRELETRRAPQLRKELERVVEKARQLLAAPPYSAEELAPGWLHAQRAVGPALVMLGTSVEFFAPSVRGEIEIEVKKIREAKTVDLPAWLSPPTASFLYIDYRRMAPAGFYTENELLGDYYRAVRWLQIVPFRVERDHELTAISLLGYGANGVKSLEDDFFTAYTRFLGMPDLRGITSAKMLRPGQPAKTSWRERLISARKWLMQGERSAVTHDRHLSTRTEAEPFRVLSSFPLPDAEMFQRLVDHNEPVSGLHVAAMIGSDSAASLLHPADRKLVSTALESGRAKIGRHQRAADERSPVYHDYLGVLSALFAPPDADAPSFMRSEFWAAKSCQTSLAGWAQMRHTFELQAKLTVSVDMMRTQPPGFIEPNPPFFRRFSEFLINTRSKLDDAGVFTATPTSAAVALRLKAALADRLAAKLAAGLPAEKISEFEEFRSYVSHSDAWDQVPDDEAAHGEVRRIGMIATEDNAAQLATALPAFGAFLRKAADDFERGVCPPPQPRKWRSLSTRWSTLQQTVARLETLLQKQLRRQPWTDEEGGFIKEYGPTMASAMGYFGNYYSPRDDAPRCVEVVNSPIDDSTLIVGTARPRVFYVLYPWNGTEVLCEGSVVPYREIRSRTKLKNEQWRALLDSPTAPPVPQWLRSISPSGN